MADAIRVRDREDNRLTAQAALAAAEVWQLPDGRAGVFTSLEAAANGDRINMQSAGQYLMPKTNGIVLLDGGQAWWDKSASAVHYKKVNDGDYYLGRIVGDAASADASCVVNLNDNASYDIDLLRDGALSVPTGTQAIGSTGFSLPQVYGGARAILLSATSEPQCIDLLSVDRVAVNANAIAEFVIRMAANGSTNAVDFSIGLANGTSTSDADAITEHVLFHIDGGDLSVFAQSKDGTTTVAATDTTVDVTAGSAVANRFELWIDARDPSSVKLYVNGVRVLSGSTFVLTNAAGPLGLLVHVEKTTGTATFGPAYIDAARLRIAEQ